MTSIGASPTIDGLATCLVRSIACTITLMKNLSLNVLPIIKAFLLVAVLWLPLAAHAEKNILVFGDSLSAAHGIALEEGWVYLLQQQLQLSHPQYHVVNASISGETTTGGRQRIAAALRKYQPGIVLIELGANDGLRGTPVADIHANLADLITQSLKTRAKVLLLGMRLPPNYGGSYTSNFKAMYPRLAKRYHVTLVPFLLEGIATEQFQADNLHPIASAQPVILQNVMQQLEPLLDQ
jgi:acyl-CoA thioesterase-1